MTRHPDEALFAKALGQAIKYARKQAGMSGAALAEQIGTNLNTISKWERGVQIPCSSSLLLISEAVKHPPSRLLAAAEAAFEKMKPAHGRKATSPDTEARA